MEIWELHHENTTPIVVLEGDRGLIDHVELFTQFCFMKGEYPIVLQNLYETPRQLMSLGFLEPKTIVLTTTGIRTGELERLFKYFKATNHLPDHIIIGMGIDKIKWMLREVLEQKPEIKVWELLPDLSERGFIIEEVWV